MKHFGLLAPFGFDPVGPKTDYDEYLEPIATAFLNELRAMPTRPRWKFWSKKKPIKTKNSYSATYFVCRNPFDPISKEIDVQYRRVTGREYDPLWDH
jgi:hypothetical protein